MDLNYINPFIQSAVEIIKEVTDTDIRKTDVFVRKGRKSSGGIGIVLDVSKDVEGRIIFDLTREITLSFARDMIGLNLGNAEELKQNKEMLESAIMELGNMISGRAITILEKNRYNCDIASPAVYIGKQRVLAPENNICIVINFESNKGNFSLCLTNKQDQYRENITFAMSMVNEYIQDELVFSFLPRGFEMFELDQLNKLYQVLSTNDINFLLIDVNNIINELNNVLSNIKSSSKNKNIHIIAYSSDKHKDVFSGLFDKYLSFILPSHFNTIECVQAMKKYFELAGIKHSQRRRHIRVPVDEKENIKISFKLNKGDVLDGKITNISLGGALFTSLNGKLIRDLENNKRYNGLQINFGGKIARATAIIAQKKEFTVAIRFTDINENFIKIISKYIFTKLTKLANV